MSEDFEQQEYFALTDAITQFDQRLLTIKGWGVTLSLAALGFGFQYRSYGLFLVSCASSLAFWAIEAVTKRHQMRHYLRLREIEVNRYDRADSSEKNYSSPRIDWSWFLAGRVFTDRPQDSTQPVQPMRGDPGYKYSFALPHVALPHAITFLVSLALFLLGLSDKLTGFSLGTAKL